MKTVKPFDSIKLAPLSVHIPCCPMHISPWSRKNDKSAKAGNSLLAPDWKRINIHAIVNEILYDANAFQQSVAHLMEYFNSLESI